MTDREKTVRELKLEGESVIDAVKSGLVGSALMTIYDLINRAHDAGAAAERARIVAWLRSWGWEKHPEGSTVADVLATAIERGAGEDGHG